MNQPLSPISLLLLPALLACGAAIEEDSDAVASDVATETAALSLEWPESPTVVPTVPDRPSLCLRPLVWREVPQPLSSIAPHGRVICDSWGFSAVCNERSAAEQLGVIDLHSWSNVGMRFPRNESSASIDVPVTSGHSAVIVQERLDRSVSYWALYTDTSGATQIHATGVADYPNYSSRGAARQRIAVPPFPAGASHTRIRIRNADYWAGRYFQRIYLVGPRCVEPFLPDDP